MVSVLKTKKCVKVEITTRSREERPSLQIWDTDMWWDMW